MTSRAKRAVLTTAIAAACAVAGSVLPGSAAAATTYCVPGPCAGGTSEPSIQAAMTAAAGDGAVDTIQVTAGTLTSSQIGPSGTAAAGVGNPVNVVGAGSAATLIFPVTAFSPTIEADDPGSSISDLELRLSGVNGMFGIRTAGHVSRVVVSSAANTANFDVGILLDSGGSLADSSVTVPTTFQTTGVNLVGTTSVARTEIHGGNFGANVQGVAKLSRLNMTGAGLLVNSTPGGDATIEDSVLHLDPGPAPFSAAYPPAGLAAVVGTAGSPAHVLARNTTIVGSGEAFTAGAVAFTNTAGTFATVDLKDSIIRNFGKSLFTAQSGGAGTARITSDYSDYDSATADTSGGGSVGPETNHLNVDPAFASSTDYRLTSASPLIDAGSPGALAAGEGPLDLAGSPRLLAGSTACTVRRDIGAYEFSPASLSASASSSPRSVDTGDPVSFTASIACEPDPSLTPTYTWTFDDGGTASGASVSHSFARAGTHTATLTVSDTGGRTGTATTDVTVRARVTPAPQTTIRGLKVNQRARTAKVRFSPSVRGATFQCRLDAKAWKPCRSPKTYRHLAPGRHTIRVRATANGATDSTPAKRTFRILARR